MIPNDKFTSSPVEVYNAVLAGHKLVEYVDLSILYDNFSLSRISQHEFKLANPILEDFNYIIT